MDRVEIELNRLWNENDFDEGTFCAIENILSKKPSYVDFFVRKIEDDLSAMDTLYLIILDVVPLDVCIQYALEKAEWVVEDFSEYSWFRGEKDFTPMSMEEYKTWLAKQRLKDERE